MSVGRQGNWNSCILWGKWKFAQEPNGYLKCKPAHHSTRHSKRNKNMSTQRHCTNVHTTVCVAVKTGNNPPVFTWRLSHMREHHLSLWKWRDFVPQHGWMSKHLYQMKSSKTLTLFHSLQFCNWQTPRWQCEVDQWLFTVSNRMTWSQKDSRKLLEVTDVSTTSTERDCKIYVEIFW